MVCVTPGVPPPPWHLAFGFALRRLEYLLQRLGISWRLEEADEDVGSRCECRGV